MKKRLTAGLLALCMALALPGAVFASEAPPEAPAAAPAAEEVQPEGTAVLPEDPELQPEDVNTAVEEAAPETVSDEAGLLDAAAESWSYTVTTDEPDSDSLLPAVTAYSATLSMTATQVGNSTRNYTPVYGFEYWYGDKITKTDLGDPDGTWEDYEGRNGDLSEENGCLQYTALVSCKPNTTYTYRAYLKLVFEDGDSLPFTADNVQTFKTLESSNNLPSLTPSGSITLPLEELQPAFFTFGEDLTGLYWLSYELSESSDQCKLAVEKNGFLSSVEPYNPIYLDGKPHSGMVTYTGQSASSAVCTLKLSPAATILPDSGTTEFFSETTYFQFTPTAARYQLTFRMTPGTNTTACRGDLMWWDTRNGIWADYTSISDGSTYLLSPENGQSVCYFRVSPYDNASCTIAVSEYTSVTEPSVRSGTAQIQNSFQAEIPVTGQVPSESAGIYTAGIEYCVDNVTEIRFGNQPAGELWTVPVSLDLFPGQTFLYHAILGTWTNEGIEIAVSEPGDWHELKVPTVESVSLSPGENGNTISSENGQEKFLAFTPTETGWYQFAFTDAQNISFWNSERASWEGFNPSLSNQLKAGETLYLRVTPANYSTGTPSCTVTVTKVISTVTSFSISAEAPSTFENFRATIRLNAAVPLGSSFRVKLLNNKGNPLRNHFERKWGANSWTQEFDVDVLPNQAYTLTPCIEEINPETNQAIGKPVYGEAITFNTTNSGFNADSLSLGTSMTKTASQESPWFACFTPSEAGIYQVSVTGGSSTDQPTLYYWDDAADGWHGSGSFSDSAEVLVSAKANVPQYLRLFTNSWNSVSYTITVTRREATVHTFSLEAGQAQTGVPGFTAEVPVTVTMPLDQYCRLEVEVLQDNGFWTSYRGAWFSGTDGEHQNTTFRLDTVPNRTYTYRVCLIPIDASGTELSNAERVYSAENTFTAASYSSDSTPALTVGETKTGTFQKGRDAYFAFTPPEAGFYRIAVTGADILSLATSNSDWDTYRDLTEPVTVRMENTQQYFCLSGGWNQNFSITVSRVTSTVTGFTVTAGEPQVLDSGLEFRVPVTVTAPIGSWYTYSVEYYPTDNPDLWLSDSGGNRNTTKESYTFQLDLPAYPGKTYVYRAYVYDQDGKRSYDEQTTHTVTIPALQTSPAVLTENQAASSGTDKSFYTFTPSRTGSYLFTASGEDGKLTILREDGSWERMYYYSGRSETDINVRLSGGKPAYVILEERNPSGTTSVTVRSTALYAAWNYENRNYDVSLETSQAGTCVFAAYDDFGRFLTAGTVQASGAGTVTSTLTVDDDALFRTGIFVKAFQTGTGYRPQAPMEWAPVNS